MRTGFERAEMTVSQCGRFLLATLFLLPSLHWDKRKCRLNRSPGSNNRHTSMYDRSRIATAFAVFVVAACASLHGQSPSKQPLDPALAVLGSGFNSDTVQVNGTTLHYVRGGTGSAVILLHGFPDDWYACHRVMPLLAKQFTVVAVDLRGLGGSAVTTDGCVAVNMAEDIHQLAKRLHLGSCLHCRSRYRWHGGVCVRPPLSGNQRREDYRRTSAGHWAVGCSQS